MTEPDPPRPLAVGRDWRELASRLRDDRRALAVLATALVLGVAAYAYRSNQASSGIPAPAAQSPFRSRSSVSPSSAPRAVSIVVHVAGAVLHTGVVTLPAGSRVVDAIDAAGGALHNADVDQLDLAAKLIDGTRIYVPRVGEHVATPSGGPSADPSPSTPLDLNTATQQQLEALPGIGPSLAQAIIAERDRRGGFASVDDLKYVRGIGERRLADLRPLVSV